MNYINRLNKYKEAKLEEVYKKYSKLIYNYIYSLCKNHDIAEDLTQETFYKAVMKINSFNNKCKMSTWLCQIAKNTWIDFLRKQKRKEIISVDNLEKFILEKSFENNIDDKEEIIRLYKHIHELDEDTREVFYLRIKGELSFKSIGEILNKSEAWARFTFYRGKLKLKEAMINDEKRM